MHKLGRIYYYKLAEQTFKEQGVAEIGANHNSIGGSSLAALRSFQVVLTPSQSYSKSNSLNMVSQTFTNGRPLRTRKADVGYVLFIGISILLALGMLAPFLPDGQTFVVRWIILANFLFVCWVAWMLYRCYRGTI